MHGKSSDSSAAAPWRFAPLNEDVPSSANARKLGGIVFDVDGTLCEPQNYIFREMRMTLGIPPGGDILAHVASLPAGDGDGDGERARAMATVTAIERRAAESQVPQPGLAALMAHLDGRGVRKALCSRNCDGPVRGMLDKFLPSTRFEPVITRDFAGVVAPKPDPEGILYVARAWGLVRAAEKGEGEGEGDTERGEPGGAGEHGVSRVGAGDGVGGTEGAKRHSDQSPGVPDASTLIMVGDSIDDTTAGRRAGAKTVLFVNKDNRHLAQHEYTDMVITRLDELIDILDNGLL